MCPNCDIVNNIYIAYLQFNCYIYDYYVHLLLNFDCFERCILIMYQIECLRNRLLIMYNWHCLVVNFRVVRCELIRSNIGFYVA